MPEQILKLSDGALIRLPTEAGRVSHPLFTGASFALLWESLDAYLAHMQAKQKAGE